jgi:hypothetical protein
MFKATVRQKKKKYFEGSCFSKSSPEAILPFAKYNMDVTFLKPLFDIKVAAILEVSRSGSNAKPVIRRLIS